jgi:type II secretory pathway predicted ATPase ExeA
MYKLIQKYKFLQSIQANLSCLVFFVVGQTGADSQLNELKAESTREKDILMVKVHEHYHNLTLKVLYAMKWFTELSQQYVSCLTK